MIKKRLRQRSWPGCGCGHTILETALLVGVALALAAEKTGGASREEKIKDGAWRDDTVWGGLGILMGLARIGVIPAQAACRFWAGNDQRGRNGRNRVVVASCAVALPGCGV